MGCFNVKMDIGGRQDDRMIVADALVDTGAFFSSAPASVLRGLGVSPIMSRNFRFGDGRIRRMNIGRTWLRVDGHEANTLIMFNEEGTSFILGALALEEMLLGIDPVEERLFPLEIFNM